MRFELSFLILLQLVIPASASAASPLRWWVDSVTVKVRPSDLPPAVMAHAAEIHAARNEFEPFQIVIRSPADVTGLDFEVSDLTNSSHNVIPGAVIPIYFVGDINLKRPSREHGETGDWPDPLIPRVDTYFHERRNAFPFTLHRNQNQAVWIDLYVPVNARAGSYTGTVRVTSKGQPLFTVPVRLTVWNFVLPSTSSLRTSFGFNGVAALKQHAGKYTSNDDLRSLTALYTRAALLDRISFYGGTGTPPPFAFNGTKVTIDWKDYDRDAGQFLDGTVLGQADPLPGARTTSTDLLTHGDADTDLKKMLYWREWATHFREHGWLDRLFYYLKDEPRVQDYPQIVQRAALVHRADPAIRTLVTLQRTASLDDGIDIWTPLINCFELKPHFDSFCSSTVPRKAYDEAIQSGKQLWWYQSCSSHGCNIEGGSYFSGWPSYMIDDTAVSNRMMPWLAWKYGIGGELYFNTVEAYNHPIDPWSDVYLFGGNGDGTLFYPGRRANIGGSRDIPIDSIRLKLIREGLEDYEYFILLDKVTSPGTAETYIDRIVHNTNSFESDSGTFDGVRLQIGKQIEKNSFRVDPKDASEGFR